jgi:MinD-like ATPase involved in chromosome partitioning or flagellar assembly
MPESKAQDAPDSPEVAAIRERMRSLHGEQRPGELITFYSYKGGVGRSMAVANIGSVLSRTKRVLLIDFDLEAPGLERYFTLDATLREETAGVVDLVHQKSLQWRDCLHKFKPFEVGFELHLISAGRADDDYVERVRQTRWDELFEKQDLGARIEAWRAEWRRAYDYILIDSRTGMTDAGGVCTILLPDVLFALFTTNQQSLEGTLQVLELAAEGRKEALAKLDRAPLRLIPLLSRDESLAERQLAADWRLRFAPALDKYYGALLPRGRTNPTAAALQRLKVPYIARWSFGEGLPVLQDLESGTADPISIGFAYDLIARYIESRYTWDVLELGESSIAVAIERERVLTKRSQEKAAEYDCYRKRMQRNLRWLAASLIAVAALAVVVVGFILRERSAEADKKRNLDWAHQVASLVGHRSPIDDPLIRALALRDALQGISSERGAGAALLRLAPLSQIQERLEESAIPRHAFSVRGGPLMASALSSDGSVLAWLTPGKLVVHRMSSKQPDELTTDLRQGAAPRFLAFRAHPDGHPQQEYRAVILREDLTGEVLRCGLDGHPCDTLCQVYPRSAVYLSDATTQTPRLAAASSSQDGHFFAALTQTGSLLLWKWDGAENADCYPQRAALFRGAKSMSFADTNKIIIGSPETGLEAWSFPEGTDETKAQPLEEASSEGAVRSPDQWSLAVAGSQFLAAGEWLSGNEVLRPRELDQLLARPKQGSSFVESVALARHLVAYLTREAGPPGQRPRYELVAYETPNENPKPHRLALDRVGSVAVSPRRKTGPDGSHLIALTQGQPEFGVYEYTAHQLKPWLSNPEVAQHRFSFRAAGAVLSATFSPDAEWLVTVADSGSSGERAVEFAGSSAPQEKRSRDSERQIEVWHLPSRPGARRAFASLADVGNWVSEATTASLTSDEQAQYVPKFPQHSLTAAGSPKSRQ